MLGMLWRRGCSGGGGVALWPQKSWRSTGALACASAAAFAWHQARPARAQDDAYGRAAPCGPPPLPSISGPSVDKGKHVFKEPTLSERLHFAIEDFLSASDFPGIYILGTSTAVLMLMGSFSFYNCGVRMSAGEATWNAWTTIADPVRCRHRRCHYAGCAAVPPRMYRRTELAAAYAL